MKHCMYQVSTLQALAMGYTKKIVTVGQCLENGDIGLGTFEDVNGEMVVLDGRCYRADENGNVSEVDRENGVPFCSLAFQEGDWVDSLDAFASIDDLKRWLDNRIEEHFGLNAMHVVRIDGTFSLVRARSEAPYHSQFLSLKEILQKTQKDFVFRDIRGTMVCIYYPDYMDGINAPGWHLHFVDEHRKKGGHVFELVMKEGKSTMDRLDQLHIQFPNDPSFDIYSLKEADQNEIKEVEQGKE
ncbi:MAG: acetolactate decarboxylase [Erysipelotrichaceae bacterium]|nr:acetolactate decarboxylase [Erysipelotrichaceae bacterium]